MTDRKKNVLFVVYAYAFFWVLLVIAGVLIMAGVLPSEGIPMNIATVLGSWTPTVALLVLFKKLFPGSSVKSFYKNVFKERLNLGLILFVTIVQVLIIVGAAGIVAFTKNVSLSSLFDLSLQTIGMGVFWSLIQGATGEESGWRGFLLPSIQKNSGVIKSSFIVGIIWMFWHAPLWLMSGYAGKDLIQYIFLFCISIISVAIIIGICYSRCKNLFIPIWIHFMFNFVLTMFTGNILDAMIWIAVLYIVAAAGYNVWHKSFVTA